MAILHMRSILVIAKFARQACRSFNTMPADCAAYAESASDVALLAWQTNRWLFVRIEDCGEWPSDAGGGSLVKKQIIVGRYKYCRLIIKAVIHL